VNTLHRFAKMTAKFTDNAFLPWVKTAQKYIEIKAFCGFLSIPMVLRIW
jgi:hypothetical protein